MAKSLSADETAKRDALRISAIGDNPTDFVGAYKDVMVNRLNQKDAGALNTIEVQSVSTTNAIADAFIERYNEQTGELPSEADVIDFVYSNGSNPQFIEKALTTGLPKETIKSTTAQNYIRANFPDKIKSSTPSIDRTAVDNLASNLQKRFDQYFGVAEQAGTDQIRDIYAGQKRTLAENQANLFGYDSPQAFGQDAQLAGDEGMAISQFLGNVANQKVANQLDFSKFGESLLAGERRAGEDMTRWLQQLDLSRSQLDQSASESAMDRALKRELGYAGLNTQKQMNEKGIFDYSVGAGRIFNDVFSPFFPR